MNLNLNLWLICQFQRKAIACRETCDTLPSLFFTAKIKMTWIDEFLETRIARVIFDIHQWIWGQESTSLSHRPPYYYKYLWPSPFPTLPIFISFVAIIFLLFRIIHFFPRIWWMEKFFGLNIPVGSIVAVLKKKFGVRDPLSMNPHRRNSRSK